MVAIHSVSFGTDGRSVLFVGSSDGGRNSSFRARLSVIIVSKSGRGDYRSPQTKRRSCRRGGVSRRRC